MNNSDMKKMLIKTSVFSVICIAAMFQRITSKHIMITDAAGSTIDRGSTDSSYNLLMSDDITSGQSGKLIIPLPRSVEIEDIVLEDHYMDHELLIYVDSREEGFYLDNEVVTDIDIIDSAVCITENDSGAVCLDFKLDGLYANESSLTENNTIEVRFFKPYDEYDKIVVVDPSAGGSDNGAASADLLEKEVTLDVALSLKQAAEKDENSEVKLYFTRLSDMDVSNDERLRLVEETQADLLVSLGTSTKNGSFSDGIFTLYSDLYYSRALNNAEFADIIEKNCASKAGCEAIGVFCANDDVILSEVEIPATKVMLGAIDGEKDSARLKDGAYKKKIAEGIYQGIISAFEEKK